MYQVSGLGLSYYHRDRFSSGPFTVYCVRNMYRAGRLHAERVMNFGATTTACVSMSGIGSSGARGIRLRGDEEGILCAQSRIFSGV